MSTQSLEPEEKKAAFGLAGIFTLRMLGLFLVLPVFALFARELPGATPLTIGLAMGAYGLTQSLLQIPFGMLSDRIGRKPVILMGLALFALGSLVAALATSIEMMILGRFLQGAGAIAAAIMALAADLTRESSRTKVMAMIGASIGFAFIAALIIGPILAAWFGLSGIFWITALLALLSAVVLMVVVPNPVASHFHRDAEPVPALIGQAMTHPSLFRLNSGVFILHMSLTAVFLVVPVLLRDRYHLPGVDHWQLYLPVMLLAMGLMVPFVIIAEKRKQMKEMLLLAIIVAGASLLLLDEIGFGLWGLGLALVLFFGAFNLAEAIMPSWVSKVAAAEMRGTAMGVFASSQFAGAFAGGLLGGFVHHRFGDEAVFFFAAAMMGLWLLLILGIQKPRHLSNHLLPLDGLVFDDAQALRQQLLALEGVDAVQVILDDGVAYMKVDNERFNSDSLAALSRATD
jgi:MFS family permease